MSGELSVDRRKYVDLQSSELSRRLGVLWYSGRGRRSGGFG